MLVPVLLCWYSSLGDINNIKKILNNGGDINSCDYDGRTALHLAAAY
jgi:ankyrin repeat protein